MPNWCMNNLDLVGPKEVLEEIAASQLSLQVLVPCPKELLDQTAPVHNDEIEKANKEKFGFPDWYSWCVSNWGTKWDIGPINNLEIENVGDQYYISVGFDSAWAPPIMAMKNIFEKYKDRGLKLYMEYFEPGCAFLGKVTAEDTFFDDCREYENADELEAHTEELENNLVGSEIEYLRECEAEKKEEEKKKTEEATSEKKKSTKKKSEKKVEKKPAKKPEKKVKKKSVKKSATK